MPDEKITITWDQLRTRQVDERVGAMQAMRRNLEYAQLAAPPEPAAPTLKSLWYNTFVYMTIFGLAGGLVAWMCGQALHFKNSARLEAAVMMDGVKDLRRAADAGRITPEEKASMIEQMARDGRRNP